MYVFIASEAFFLEMFTFASSKFYIIWDKVFKSGLSKFFGRQPLKNFKNLKFLMAVFHKISLVHSWILCSIYVSVFRNALDVLINNWKLQIISFWMLYFPKD